MDLTNIFGGNIAKQIIIWSVGSAISGFLLSELKSFLIRKRHQAVQEISHALSNIKDPYLRESAKNLVKYIAENMPDKNNSQKLQEAISTIKRIVPDILIKDDEIENLIEEVYSEFKNELKEI